MTFLSYVTGSVHTLCQEKITRFKNDNSSYRKSGIASVIDSSVVDSGFKHRSDQTKDYEIGICCFSAKHATSRHNSKDRSSWNGDNVWKWSDIVYTWTVVSVC